jgi:signal transduction histidine kinase
MIRDEGLAQDVASVRSIKAVPTILDIVCRTTGMRFAAVARVTEDRWVACSVRDDIAFGLVPGGELKVESTICDEIRQSGQAVIIDHATEDNRFCAHPTPAMYGFQSYISMPIRLSDGSFFGTLCAIDPEPRRLNTPDTVEMFEMFANVIGFHLSAIDRLTATEASLSVERENAVLREQFIAVLGHDLRNPLAAITSGMQLLQRSPLTPRSSTIVKMIQDSAARMAGLIDDVTDFARGRLGGGLTLNRNGTAPIEPILRQVVAEVQASAPRQTVQAVFEITEAVNCDHRRLAQLASNLLSNAVTYGASGEPVRVSATAADGTFTLSVANAGEPIAPLVLQSIFEPFTRGTVDADKQGLGLGLYIAHQIAVAHGGNLDVVSTSAETRFTFRMPLA